MGYQPIVKKIKGIGKQTADILLKEFRSVKKIKEASDADIEKLVGRAKLELIKTSLQ